jgi:hypothetical protein
LPAAAALCAVPIGAESAAAPDSVSISALRGSKEEPVMADEATTPAKLGELRQQLESISGRPVDASDEQLLQLFFRVSLSNYEDGTILSRSIIFPGKSCTQASALPASFLDVSSSGSTDATGRRTFLLTDFICSTLNTFAAPVTLLVTPNTETPCYATMTHALVPDPNAPGYNDLQFTVFTWNANGRPAPNISFDWRCRLLSFQIIE